jgi:hypothetical protein
VNHSRAIAFHSAHLLRLALPIRQIIFIVIGCASPPSLHVLIPFVAGSAKQTGVYNVRPHFPASAAPTVTLQRN